MQRVSLALAKNEYTSFERRTDIEDDDSIDVMLEVGCKRTFKG
jgi:hypothetical protein